MFGTLPPAGERILLSRNLQKHDDVRSLFHPYLTSFYNSGTAALAASISAAATKVGVIDPEVILPAYTCPHLVSAILRAKARPILVDLALERPWLDLDALSAAITPRTVAVISVDMFGLPERNTEIRARIAGTAITLIQDSAQAFPKFPETQWQGDYVVLSFGRGKPVSLLHGGAVLARDPELISTLPIPLLRASSWYATPRMLLRSVLYNALLSRFVYWLPSSLPFLRLGETHFEPLVGIGAMDQAMLDLLPVNVYACRERESQAELELRSLLLRDNDPDIIDLAAVCCAGGTSAQLLRYPILVRGAARRARLYECLQRAGLGASKLYQRALPEIPGLEAMFAGVDVPQARRFADSLLSLPVHSRVRSSDIEKMGRCINASRTELR